MHDGLNFNIDKPQEIVFILYWSINDLQSVKLFNELKTDLG